MPRLFDREIVLNAGGLRIASRSVEGVAQPILRTTFQITRSLKKDPNTATITLYNLNKTNRAALQKKNISTIVEAGYTDNVSQIFGGQLQFGSSVKSGTDWITTIQSGDGADKFKSARINTSHKGPIKLNRVLEIAGEALGVNLGNLKKKAAEGGVRAVLDEFTEGVVLSGKAEQVFSNIAKSMGFTWSIQDEQILLLGPGETLEGKAVLLQPGSGLVGSPEPGEKGIVKARSLLQPQLVPGKKVRVESEEVSGLFRVDKIVYSGDSWGGNWYCDMELRPL